MIHHPSVPGKSRSPTSEKTSLRRGKGGIWLESIHHTFNMEAERIACYTRFSLFTFHSDITAVCYGERKEANETEFIDFLTSPAPANEDVSLSLSRLRVVSRSVEVAGALMQSQLSHS
jgi:hypothetical protein